VILGLGGKPHEAAGFIALVGSSVAVWPLAARAHMEQAANALGLRLIMLTVSGSERDRASIEWL